MKEEKVYVVGFGGVSPLGKPYDMFKNLRERASGTLKNTFNTYRVVNKDFNPVTVKLWDTIAAQVQGFHPEDYLDRKEILWMDPFTQFAVHAAEQAVQQSGLIFTDSIRKRMALVIGTGLVGLTHLENQYRRLLTLGAAKVSPHLVPAIMPNATLFALAKRFRCYGPGLTPIAACATGVIAIGEAFLMIKSGRADCALTGATEAVITPLAMATFGNMRALCPETQDPQHRSRPFDLHRNGFVMGEGAGVLFLVSRKFAEKHNLVPLAEVAGYANVQDPHHITFPDPEATCATMTIDLALKDAHTGTDEIVYINPHATGTDADPIEALAIRNIFGERAARTPISSSKGGLGHTMAAAGALEAMICILTNLQGWAHPAINLEIVDPKCAGLGHILGGSCAISPGPILKTSFGFGGANAALIIGPA